ncbi:MAG: prepilin-type N-terminal cleavage/methylation domain-containing protein [Acidobacteriia bacterium]|nr:prepilin-type N-terminal cleavage/methylation domain-containing protein [Terriglobia bacterium]
MKIRIFSVGNSFPLGTGNESCIEDNYPAWVNPTPRKHSNHGFTLLELLVVMLILTVLILVAVPSITRGLASLRLENSSRQIAAALRVARAKAIRKQEIYFMEFDMNKVQVTLACPGNGYQKIFSLPEGISFSKVTLLNEKKNVKVSSRKPVTFFFLPNGISQAFEVRLKNERGREFKIIQDALLKNSPRIEEVLIKR